MMKGALTTIGDAAHGNDRDCLQEHTERIYVKTKTGGIDPEPAYFYDTSGVRCEGCSVTVWISALHAWDLLFGKQIAIISSELLREEGKEGG